MRDKNATQGNVSGNAMNAMQFTRPKGRGKTPRCFALLCVALPHPPQVNWKRALEIGGRAAGASERASERGRQFTPPRPDCQLLSACQFEDFDD